MTEEKSEDLQEEQTPETEAQPEPETKKEEAVEAEEAETVKPVEEKADVVEDEPVVEESKPEAEVEEESDSEKEKEALAVEIRKTAEELSVVKEVREELVSTYAKLTEAKQGAEQLTKDRESIAGELSELKDKYTRVSEQLSIFVEAEKLSAAKERTARLEKLSSKFTLLGQKKSVEQLAVMDETTLNEFETIVDAALDKTAETREALSETEPVGAAVLDETKAQEMAAEPVQVTKEPEALRQTSFFANICGELTKEQTTTHRGRAKSL